MKQDAALRRVQGDHSDTSSRRIHRVDEGLALLVAGMPPDGRALVAQARAEAKAYAARYGETITGAVLADKLSSFIYSRSAAGSHRPMAVSGFIASYQEQVSKPVARKSNTMMVET